MRKRLPNTGNKKFKTSNETPFLQGHTDDSAKKPLSEASIYEKNARKVLLNVWSIASKSVKTEVHVYLYSK